MQPMSSIDWKKIGNSRPGKRVFDHPEQGNYEKFIPTCAMCGEKHWPFSPLVPCVNKDKILTSKAEREAKDNTMSRM